ncbi:MAG: acetoacetate--CoA ligase [Hyphomonadaceae bacterium]|jgi:acetoacetyl-CoA synthetase|nr:acetoacetate--CoA ligase [Hyphomonadaceae bacterium]
MTTALWTPTESRISQTTLHAFSSWLSSRTGKALIGYDELHRYSIEDPAEFWSALWDFTKISGDKGSPPFLVDGSKMPGAQFFPGAKLNFAENLLRHTGPGDAMVFWGEDKVKRWLSWDELRTQVSKAARSFAAAGVTAGDRVAGILPNMPESITSALGAAAIGAVWSSCSPDFGVQGVLDRFGQIAPSVLVACDGYYYNGKAIDITDKLAAILAKLPSVRMVIIVPYLGDGKALVQGLNAGLVHSGRRAQTWDDAVLALPAAPLTFARLPFSHPLYVLFSSGTTGMPKCIVHSAGGTLLKHVCEQQLHSDIKAGDRLFYFTTLGWMMWNWLASGLANGATLLLYDGSPFHPSGSILWDYAQAERSTHFGASAKYIDALKKADLAPAKTHDLSSIRVMLSTGSPLAPESYDYVYEAIKADLHLASISGGTDICGCFVLGIPTKPVWRGEIQGPGLGMAVGVVDESASPVPQGKGELVCLKPFPSMPIGFWNDPEGEKYRAAYFARFDNIWQHGDFAEWTEHGGMIIHGRSDATLNPGGVRIGTAEIYRQVEQLDEVQESIVIGQDWDHDVRVVLFVVLRPGLTLDEALRARIKQQIRTGASPRHVPAKIVQVADIPRTKSGKITELAVRDVVHGREVKNKEALANPEALELYRDMAELRAG